MYKVIDRLVDMARMVLFYATIFVSGIWWWIIPNHDGLHERFARACIWLVGLLVFGFIWMQKRAPSGPIKVALGYWVPLGLATLGFIFGVISRFLVSIR